MSGSHRGGAGASLSGAPGFLPKRFSHAALIEALQEVMAEA